jgi:hypothetical protein
VPPERPAVPLSYLIHLSHEIHGGADLSRDRQLRIFSDLRSKLSTSDARGAKELLLALRARPDVTYEVAQNIDALLARPRSRRKEPAPIAPEPPPPLEAPLRHRATPGPRRRRRWLIAAAVVVVAAGGAGAVVLFHKPAVHAAPPAAAPVFTANAVDRKLDEGANLRGLRLVKQRSAHPSITGALPQGLHLQADGAVSGTIASTASDKTTSFDVAQYPHQYGNTPYTFTVSAHASDGTVVTRSVTWTVQDTELSMPIYFGTRPKPADPTYPDRIFQVDNLSACVDKPSEVGEVWTQDIPNTKAVAYGAKVRLWYGVLKRPGGPLCQSEPYGVLP